MQDVGIACGANAPLPACTPTESTSCTAGDASLLPCDARELAAYRFCAHCSAPSVVPLICVAGSGRHVAVTLPLACRLGWPAGTAEPADHPARFAVAAFHCPVFACPHSSAGRAQSIPPPSSPAASCSRGRPPPAAASCLSAASRWRTMLSRTGRHPQQSASTQVGTAGTGTAAALPYLACMLGAELLTGGACLLCCTRCRAPPRYHFTCLLLPRPPQPSATAPTRPRATGCCTGVPGAGRAARAAAPAGQQEPS